jgi:DNA (cytosine-5)-methyltransferase 3A
MGWKLFMRFVDAVRIIKPRFFLLENVASMPSNIKAYISEELGCEPVFINSSLVSAQHRKRLYWTNINGSSITQPKDRGILLKDIIFFTDKSSNALSMAENQKTGLSIANDAKETAEVGAALRTREDESGKYKRLEVRNDGKINALTTVQTDSVVCTPVRIGTFGKGGQAQRIYSVRGKSVSIKSQGGGGGALTGLYKIELPDGDYTIRKLTPTEAERCQTLDDGYTALGTDDNGNTVKISNTQRYRAIGNGFTVEVISHILSHMR